MELGLNTDALRLIEQNVQSGRYDSAEAVVHAALATLAQSSGDFQDGEWDRLLREGEASGDADGTLDGDEALAARRLRRAVNRK